MARRENRRAPRKALFGRDAPILLPAVHDSSTAMLIKDHTLGQIEWEQMVFLGSPEYGVEPQPIDFVRFVHACGGVGFRCETPDEVGPAPRAAFASKGPAQPARATFTQGLHPAESLARGGPHRGRIATTRFHDKIEGRPGLSRAEARPHS